MDYWILKARFDEKVQLIVMISFQNRPDGKRPNSQ
jgi:hypothetical protein